MENPDKQNCVKIGYFKKPHGVAGTLLLNFDPAWENSLLNAGVMLTDTEGLLVPWFVQEEGIRIISNVAALVDLDWIGDENAARKLCGMDVYLEKRDIDSDDGEYISGDWTGYALFDNVGAVIGKVTAIDDFAGNIVCTVETPAGERMIPIHPDFIRRVDDDARAVFMELPDGILDI